MPASWKDEEATTPSSPPDEAFTEGARTSRERCKRCGERAIARCVGCAEAFCKLCVDPVSKGAPDVRCRECARRLDGTTKLGIPALLEQTLEQCLTLLAAREVTPLVRAMRNEVAACQEELDSWRADLPPSETRAVVRGRVAALFERISRETG